jgi:hypothetical protein
LLLIALFLLLATGLNTADYFIGESYFNYPGFHLFSHYGVNLLPLMDVPGNIRQVGIALLVYALYACVRETIIYFLGRAGERANYRVWVMNQVSLFLVLFLVIPLFISAFDILEAGSFFNFYFSYLLPVIIVFLNNIYWLFPLKGETPFFSSRILWRLILSTFLYTVPFVMIVGQPAALLPVLLLCWGVQLSIVTPLSWIVYGQRKDKILQWRMIGQALIKSKADLQFLRSQINPHFLFNILNTLYGTALQEQAAHTAEGIQKLGDMMRFMLDENTHEFIRLDREIGYLKNYISLQKLRTQSLPGITIEDDIGEEFGDHRIAPMLLIPFVENAFKHGISLQEKSWISLALSCDENAIRFEVRNSMHSSKENDPEREKSGIGLKNVLERLKLMYADKHVLDIDGNGTEYRVKLVIFIS